MSCDDIREQLVETARARELSSDLRKIVFSHAAGCADCGRRLEDEQRLTYALGELALSAERAPARLEQGILRQLRVVPIRRFQRSRFVWSGAAVAAAGAAAFFLMSDRAPAPPDRTAAVLHSPAPALSVRETIPTRLAETNVRHRVSEAKPAPSADDADSFTPLPYAPELGLDEQAEVVRVEMPREALRSMGVPVDNENSDERIQADVLIGPDGTARSIRVAN